MAILSTRAASTPYLAGTRAVASGAAAWRPTPYTVFGWAVVIALLMSAQMLFQPFVWRNWTWDEVMLAWLRTAAERLVVALAIATALLVGWRVPARTLLFRATLLAGAIAVSATIAQMAVAEWTGTDARPIWVLLVNWSVIAASVAAMFYLWRHGAAARQALQEAELRHVAIERQAVQARLQALRSQIEPHFLFNTLATVRSLQHSDPERGAMLLVHLVDYLRATASGLAAHHTTLGDELELVAGYLGVLTLRMSGRLTVRFDVPDDLRSSEFPSLVVATLVENAVKHGLAPLPAGGSIEVVARREGTSLVVSVTDTGVGFSGPAGSGIGLANVRSRMWSLYGTAGALTLEAHRPSGVRASIRLPLAPSGAAA